MSLTKQDLQAIQSIVTTSFNEFEVRFDIKLERLEARVDEKLDKLEDCIDGKLQRLEDRMDAKFVALDNKLSHKIDSLQLDFGLYANETSARLTALESHS